MAVIFEEKTNIKPISFENFIDQIESIVSEEFNESMIAKCIEPLQSISKNENFLINFFNKELNKTWEEFQANNVYSEQSFVLHHSKWFYVRLTYWPINSNNNKIKKAENKLFFYNLAHDHNFPFLTVGCKGSGYISRMWEYDYEDVIGYKNEKVHLNFLEETSLSRGKVMYYRPSKDIHLQKPPTQEDCIALNIIFNNYTQFDNRQYTFNIENHTIMDVLPSSNRTIYGILNLSKYLNDKNVLKKLNHLRKQQQNPIVRRKITEILFEIDGNTQLWCDLANDSNKSNRMFANLQLENHKTQNQSNLLT